MVKSFGVFYVDKTKLLQIFKGKITKREKKEKSIKIEKFYSISGVFTVGFFFEFLGVFLIQWKLFQIN